MILRDGEIEPDEGSRVAMSHPPNPRRLRLRNLIANVMNTSHVLSLANYALVNLLRDWSNWKSALRARQTAASASGIPADYVQWWPFLSPEDKTPPVDPRLMEASKVGDAIIRKIYQEVQEHNAEFRLIIIDLELQVHPDQARRSEFLKQHGMVSLDRAERRLLEFCARERIPAEALTPSIEPLIPPGVAIRGFPGHAVGDGHYNLIGHKLIADYLTRMLLRTSPLLQQASP